MGINCPSQNAHPLGAKLKGKMRISATNGSAMTSSSGLRREDPEQGNDEAHAEVRLHVLVRLVAADNGNDSCWKCDQRIVGAISACRCRGGGGQNIIGRGIDRRYVAGTEQGERMVRYLLRPQSDRFPAARLTRGEGDAVKPALG